MWMGHKVACCLATVALFLLPPPPVASTQAGLSHSRPPIHPYTHTPTHPHTLYTVKRQGTGVAYRKGYVLGVGVNVIEADLSDPGVRVTAMVAEGGIGSAERFARMVR